MKRRLLASVAVTALVASAAGFTVARLVEAEDAGPPSSLVPVVPCRLADTRPAPDNVGTKSSPLGPNEQHTFQVTGANGNCTIPAGATGIASNVTVVNPTAASFLTIFPAGATRPLTANLNWTPTSSPTPNQVTVGLSAGGAITAYNLTGNIDVVIDIVGYYVASVPGPAGPPGAPGAPGATGATGVVGVSAFGGEVGASLVVPAGSWAFVGPTATLGTGLGQRMFGTASTSVGFAADPIPVPLMGFSLCYRPTTGGIPQPFSPTVYTVATVSGNRGQYSASALVSPPVAGTWNVGMCIKNNSLANITLNANDYTAGWVMIAND